MIDAERLFATLRAEFGPLTQANVDAVNAALGLGSAQDGAPAAKLTPSRACLDPRLFAAMSTHLNREEGRIPHAYQDHLGFWTIGVGRLIDKRKGGRLTDEEIDHLLANDILRFIDAMKNWPSWQAVKDDPIRATAMLSMCFQMGANGLAGFKNSLALIAAKRWKEAADNLRQSKWAQQTPARAGRVTRMIERGDET